MVDGLDGASGELGGWRGHASSASERRHESRSKQEERHGARRWAKGERTDVLIEGAVLLSGGFALGEDDLGDLILGKVVELISCRDRSSVSVALRARDGGQTHPAVFREMGLDQAVFDHGEGTLLDLVACVDE